MLKNIGNTPMIKIEYKYKGKTNFIYSKLEYYNLTGSIKDRVAFYMINNAKVRGTLKEKQPLIEATSGNTGIGLAMVAAIKGYKLTLTMPETMSVERRNLLKAFGANIVLTPGATGMKGAIQVGRK